MYKKEALWMLFVVSCLGVGVSAYGDSKIVQYENKANGNRYHFYYYTDYGISRDEKGELVNKNNEEVMVIQGYYSYTGSNGKRYNVTYVADENGYRAKTKVADFIADVPYATLG